MLNLRQAVFMMAAGALALAGAGRADAQDYPSKPITIVVANAPGDIADLSARILAPALSSTLGQPVVVQNRPGAGGLIGAEYVATQAPADGYTIGSLSVNATLILPLTVKNIRFDPLKDLPPFVSTVSSKLVMATPAQEPWKTFGEMLDSARANPGKLNYGSSSSTTRLLTEVLLREQGLNVVYVPYSSTEANMTGMMGGATQMGFTTESQALSAGDKFRVLAQTGSQRSARLPDVPTFAEVGFPRVPGAAYTLNLRGGTPKPIVDKLYAAISQALLKPDIRAQLQKLSVDIADPAPSDIIIANESALYKDFASTAQQIGLKPE